MFNLLCLVFSNNVHEKFIEDYKKFFLNHWNKHTFKKNYTENICDQRKNIFSDIETVDDLFVQIDNLFLPFSDQFTGLRRNLYDKMDILKFCTPPHFGKQVNIASKIEMDHTIANLKYFTETILFNIIKSFKQLCSFFKLRKTLKNLELLEQLYFLDENVKEGDIVENDRILEFTFDETGCFKYLEEYAYLN